MKLFGPQGGQVKVRWLVLQLALVFALLLGHVLQVEDGTTLWVVEAGRPVEKAQHKQGAKASRHSLQA